MLLKWKSWSLILEVSLLYMGLYFTRWVSSDMNGLFQKKLSTYLSRLTTRTTAQYTSSSFFAKWLLWNLNLHCSYFAVGSLLFLYKMTPRIHLQKKHQKEWLLFFHQSLFSIFCMTKLLSFFWTSSCNQSVIAI